MRTVLKLKSVDMRRAIAKAGKLAPQVRAAVTLAAKQDTRSYVPWLSGDLARSADAASDLERGRLVYDTDYARAQYFGYPRKSKGVHPLATTRWFEVSRAVNFRKWLRAAEATARKVMR